MTSFQPVTPTKETKKWLVKYLNQHPMLKSFSIGAFSGTCSTLLFQPFDLVKTRVQSAVVSGGSVAGSGRIGAILIDVVKNEQFLGLWKGTAPSLIRCVPGVGFHFCCLDTLQSHFCEGRQPTAIEALTFGMASRSLAGGLLIPTTVVKTRYESGIYAYSGMIDAVRHTYRSEGVRGLTSGLFPTLMRDVPFSGLYFMFYFQMKSVVLRPDLKSPKNQTSTNSIISSSFLTFMCGINAGLMASVVTQPMDVVKTHMQLYPKQFPSSYKTVIFIMKNKGFNGFFTGLVPRMLRRTLVASMAWTVYEQAMKSIGIK